MKYLAALWIVTACSAADWTCAASSQKHEKILSVESVGKLQLVVKRKLGAEPLSPPVMLGRLVTHRGIKDLVFISGDSNVYAVDTDLGTLFWQRNLEAKSPVTPLLGPGDGDDDDDAISMGIRPLFLLRGGGGGILTLNAGSGADFAPGAEIPMQVRECSRKAHRVEAAVANGVRFELANGHTRPILRAINTADGRELYRSGTEIEAPIDSSGLAIANGHVCFGDIQGTLYCFGFPVDL
jgi:outer membrane protein assembly factor BamB